MSSFKERVFSGMQSNGNLHLGNYLGAIVKFVELQRTHECLYCVVDLHAITTPQDPVKLRENIREVAGAYIASGVDPKKNIVFNQSQVAEHAELAWVLNCVARMGWLGRMTQFKDKAGKDRENASPKPLRAIDSAKSLLNFCAMSRESSRCCFWSSPTGTCVAL